MNSDAIISTSKASEKMAVDAMRQMRRIALSRDFVEGAYIASLQVR